ncbi:hypothetical protein DES32_0835 [Methylovirgula ligni]|uniref:Uncharacterized protein n=1 Tax=Methylovirgula ligni TaxID=569860 RepID=A0A3D9Z5R6_9HYPH|nr:hypothetical protein [Methylovirgula ligni]REF89608.1 hypothetical protein DES32_0835 [Methylovirgula ligni]
MGNRSRRRAWEISVLADPRLNETDKRVALAVAEMDRRGFVLCERDDDFYFERKDQWQAKLAA